MIEINTHSDHKTLDKLLSNVAEDDLYRHKIKLRNDNDGLVNDLMERKNLLYLKDDLKLIKQLFKGEEEIVYCLTKKGNEVIKEGGWNNYYEKQKKIKRNSKRRRLALFWVGVIIPVIAVTISLITVIFAETEREKTVELQERMSKLESELLKDKTPSMPKTDSLYLLNQKGKDSL